MLPYTLRALRGRTQTLLISCVMRLRDLEKNWAVGNLPNSEKKEFAKENDDVSKMT